MNYFQKVNASRAVVYNIMIILILRYIFFYITCIR